MKYYHVSRVKLADDVTHIDPQYYGRIASHGLKPEYFDQFWKEMIFEKARRTFNPDKVSRFGCVFLVDSLEQAEMYKLTFDYAANGVIYEVEPAAGARIDRFDLKHLNCNDESDLSIQNHARMYYGGYRHSQVFWEFLHDGPVKIKKIVE